MGNIEIPNKYLKKLSESSEILGMVMTIINYVEPILNKDPYFFPEYTRHNCEHVNTMLSLSEKFISKKTFKYLTCEDLSVLILSIAFHDVSMHITYSFFMNLIKQENIANNIYKDKPWKVLWNEYLKEFRLWDREHRINLFGKDVIFNDIPNDKLDIKTEHILLIGDFIRKYHHRISYEIILSGFFMTENNIYFNIFDTMKYVTSINNLKNIIADTARSHGENLWGYVSKIEEKYSSKFSIDKVHNVHILYLICILRLVDYLDISKGRAPLTCSSQDTFLSPISKKEWEVNQHISNIRYDLNIPESIYITVEVPKSSNIYLQIQQLIISIQQEFDQCWAVIGYIYKENFLLSYRRIFTNFYEDNFLNSLNYIPEDIKLRVSKKMLRLLIGPLYNYDYNIAIRELIQNSIDACNEKKFLVDTEYDPEIEIKLINNNNVYQFEITDNGMGMDKDIIINYFLVAGSSYKDSTRWKSLFSDSNGETQIIRIGQFGIGFLACFMLGRYIRVKTSYYQDNDKFDFITQLDTEHIQLNKSICFYGSGTKITIDIDKKTYEKICNDIKNTDYTNNMCWLNFYKFNSPRLKIFINDDEYKRHDINLIDYKNFNKFETDDNIIVYWMFDNKDNVIYNGLMISEEPSIEIPGFKKITICIFDKDNKLELSLDRNHINYSILKDKIIKHICLKHLLSLLKIDVDKYNYSHVKNIIDEYIDSEIPISDRIFYNMKGYNQIGLFKWYNKTIVAIENPKMALTDYLLSNDKYVFNYSKKYRELHNISVTQEINYYVARYELNDENISNTYNNQFGDFKKYTPINITTLNLNTALYPNGKYTKAMFGLNDYEIFHELCRKYIPEFIPYSKLSRQEIIERIINDNPMYSL